MSELGRFGAWVVEHPVGRGAMATVYRCHHAEHPERLAAVKVLHEVGEDRRVERLGRFAREARVLRRLDHPGIVRVLDSGTSDPEPWIALELVSGEALHLARPGARPDGEVCGLAVELADALVHAHRVGVFHRDVKPSNILIDRAGRVRLVDFGIAFAVDDSLLADQRGMGPGTVSYSPPEWLRSTGDFSPALADAYALGVVLWELLTGQRAFEQEVERLDPGDTTSPALRAIIGGLTEAAPSARLPLEDAHARLLAARASAEGPATPAPVTPPALPEPGNAFVGRKVERDRIGEWLGESVRLVTLTGPGGVGKTRLALRLAHENRSLFCDLSSATSLAGIHRALGRALGVPLVEGEAGEQLLRALRGRGPVLLVLDNAEQVVRLAADEVSRWLRAAPELRVLVTSRERLRVPGERVLAVPPLPAADAVQLLIERAREAGHEPAGSLEAVVQALDGLPLAIELAASRALDPGEGLPGTLRASLDWSWDLLSDDERGVLAQCSVFEGVFPLDAAEAVLDHPPGAELLDVLQGLVDRSLLQVRRHEGGFGMLRTVRRYAAERLPEPEPLRKRHAEWFARLADGPSRRVLPPSEAEVDNARAACDWSIRVGQPALALRTALVVGEAAYRSGPLVPEVARTQRALALGGGSVLDRVRVWLRLGGLLERSLRPDEASSAVDEALALLDGVSEPLWRGRALAAAARVGWLRRAPEATVALLEQAITLLRDARDAQLAHALALRANVQWSLRQPLDQARRDLEEAAAVLDAEPDPYVLAMVLGVRALVLSEPLDRVIRLARRSGYVAIELDAQCMAGIDALVTGDLPRAEALLTQALAGSQRCGFLGREADSAAALAEVALRSGRLPEAEQRCRDVLRIRGEDDESAHPAICNVLGLVAAARRQPDASRRWFGRADERAEAQQLPLPLRVETLAVRASILADLGQPEPAAEALARAEALMGQTPVDPATMAGRMLARARSNVAMRGEE